MKKLMMLAVSLLLVLALGACQRALGPTYTADLSGENQVPPVVTEASGTATATVIGERLVVDGSYSNLSSELRLIGEGEDASPVHIHRAPAGENGPVVLVLGLNGTPANGVISGNFSPSEFTPDLRAALEAGELYINIHTEDHPSGEIRGQLTMD